MDARTFLPIDRRFALAAGESLPDRTTGTVLFADIAGFTPLTEGLSRELGARRGPEELTRHLNGVYGGLIGLVHDYGGSVVGFGGDAITCWFDRDDGHRAATCAAEIHDAMREFGAIETPAGDRFELAVKIAIATGPVRRFVVGDPELRRLDVLAGRILDDMASAERLAGAGETVVTEPVAVSLGRRVTIEAWRESDVSEARVARLGPLAAPSEPCPWPEATEEWHETQGAPWLWPSVAQRVEKQHGRFIAELRPVVSLFLQFGGLDYDEDPEASSRLDAFVCAVEAIVDRHAGTLLELSFGDKGSLAYACFGAPIADTEAPARAVAAGLELLKLVQANEVMQDARVGIARGNMRTGAYGCPDRATYSVMGERTNLAARLMAATAAGTVLCDDAVFGSARRLWQMEARPPMQVKGMSEPVPVYRPTGARAHVTAQPDEPRRPLVGRQEELAWLLDGLADARAGKQRVRTIIGEGGIGKSRLVAELVAAIRKQGLRVATGAGQSIEQHTAFRAWRDILSEGFGLSTEDDKVRRRALVESSLRTNAPSLLERAPLLEDILSLGWQDNALTASMAPSLRHDSLVDLVVSLLRRWAQSQPCILVLDDAQWLDDLSWSLAIDVARGLAATASPLLMVLASRPADPGSPSHRHRTALESMVFHGTLTLGGLDPEGSVALAAHRLGVTTETMPERLATLVRDRAGGNPFFAEALVLDLRERGVVRVASDPNAPQGTARRQCILEDGFEDAGEALPTDVQGLVLSRIDRLAPATQLVLRTASVFGRSFALKPLSHALAERSDLPRQSIVEALEDLAAHDLAALESTQPDLQYAFSHMITQESAYNTLLFLQRRTIHGAVARWYELEHGTGDGAPPEAGMTSLEPYYPLLTHHYRRAEDVDREAVYGLLAGEQAAATYANADAIAYLGRVLEIVTDQQATTRFRALKARESVFDRTGRREQQSADVDELAALARSSSDERWRVATELRRANLALVHGAFDDAQAAADRGSKLAAKLGDADSEALARILLGKLLWQQGMFQAARPVLEQALSQAMEVQAQSTVAECRLNLGAIERHQLNLVEAQSHFEKALIAYETLGDAHGQAGCLSTLGAIAGESGDFAEADRLSQRALTVSRMIGHRRGISIIEGNIGADRFELGDLEGARSHLSSALQTCRELGDRWGEAVSLDTLGLVHQIEEQLGEALDTASSALEIQHTIGDQHGAGYTRTHLADIHIDLGDLGAAAASHEEALALRRELEQPAMAMDNVAGLARVALARGDAPAAREHAEALVAWIAEHGTEGMEFPVLVEWTLHRALDALATGALSEPEPHPASSTDVSRAAAALERAHALVTERAEGIADPELRTLFLENVPFNREVMEAWAQRESADAPAS